MSTSQAKVRPGHSTKPVEANNLKYPTLTEMKQQLPAHCFKATIPLSVYYVLRDTALAVGLVLLMRTLWFSYFNIAALTYPLYAFALGTVMWGIFVLGHDCGHGSFSPYSWMNFLFGCYLHSAILVPYYTWKLTHHYHHKNTGNIDNDEVFYPVRAGDAAKTSYKVVTAVAKLTSIPIFWFFYLMFGYAPKNYIFYHFWPFYDKFKKHWKQICLSHVGWASMAYFLYKWVQAEGFYTVIFLYFIPLGVFGIWLVVTTFLHHHEAGTVNWYSGDKWTYVKGNLSSVDRIYGPILDNVTHHIGTHQVHHLFPIIPHYHLLEVTQVFRQKFPQFVRASDKPILSALVTNTQNFVAKGVVPDDVDEVVL